MRRPVNICQEHKIHFSLLAFPLIVHKLLSPHLSKAGTVETTSLGTALLPKMCVCVYMTLHKL